MEDRSCRQEATCSNERQLVHRNLEHGRRKTGGIKAKYKSDDCGSTDGNTYAHEQLTEPG
jgi:hypothetical protein